MLSWSNAALIPDVSRDDTVENPDALLWVLLQKLFRFVDLCRQVRASASVRMVEQHELPMSLSDHFFRESSVPVPIVSDAFAELLAMRTYEVSKINVASFLVIFWSKPPL